ncbi:efflux RND transporter permease subunit [Neptuniibacter sp.]|uniref:efflux RND transporter permease subunit n=1 Tax=Neptuniibacter sp. TaxID=1962643 RepID=UPI002614110C|nr:efflux RND transporter permease subunit [Neptuniibacter sp.]MCP4596487.1 efflux RND transporter permease subunit [Neptuniibacter sp.]
MLGTIIQQGRLLTVITLMICLLGIVASMRMPVQMIPDLDAQVIEIQTYWPGATPQDIEKEILLEQERHLRTIPNLVYMESKASTGSSEITLEFPAGTNLDQTMIDVINSLNQVPSYPENVDQPRISSSSFSENPFMYFSVTPLPGNPFQLDMDMVSDFIDRQVRPVMERVKGVSKASMFHTERQIRIDVRPDQLAQRGLSLSDVRNAIRSRNRDFSAGDLEEGKRRYLLRTQGRFNDLEDLSNLIIRHENGVSTYLKDVAHIELDHYEKSGIAFVGGERASTISIRREPGANVIQIKQDMLKVVEQLRKDVLLPNGMTIQLIGDDVRYVEASIKSVVKNLALGALLASLVLYLFMRSGRATLFCLLGLPVCTIAAFVGLMLFERSINVISLAGITFAIGMTLDNSIVVLESIEQKMRQGLQRFEAAVAGVRDVWTAVIASSATTVLVFTPIFFVQQEAGQLYSDIAITVSASILASMVFALFVVPAACAYFGLASPRQVDYNRGKLMGVIRWLNGGVKRRIAVLVLSITGTLGLAIIFMPAAEYLPEGEEPKAFSLMFSPAGYSLQEMTHIGMEVKEKADKALERTPLDYQPDQGIIPGLRYYLMFISSNRIFLLSEPKDYDQLDPMMQEITQLFTSYPGMRAFSSRGSIISSNRGGTRTVVLNISGADQQALFTAAQNIMRRSKELFDNPRLNSSPSSLSLDQPLIQILPKWERMAELGLDAQSFGISVAAYSDGAFVGEFIDGDKKVDMFLYSDIRKERSIEQLAQIPIYVPDGGILPLSAVADIRETIASEDIRRIEGQRTVSVHLLPPPNVALETAIEKVRSELIPLLKTEGEIPPRVTISISGAADQLDATQEALLKNFIIAAILIYLLLVVILAHWTYPGLILTTVPLGIAGGVVGLVLVNMVGSLMGQTNLPAFHQAFDMITLLGFVILLGTVVNNPILIVCQARNNLQLGTLSVTDAVNRAVAQRLKPIIMSTVTTVFGLAPLVFIPGAGTELYRGVGIVVMMGILFSVVITLAFLPCLLVFWFRLQQRFSKTELSDLSEKEAQ